MNEGLIHKAEEVAKQVLPDAFNCRVELQEATNTLSMTVTLGIQVNISRDVEIMYTSKYEEYLTEMSLYLRERIGMELRGALRNYYGS